MGVPCSLWRPGLCVAALAASAWSVSGASPTLVVEAAARGGAPVALVAESWQVEDGLPQGSVLALVQSPAGDLWFGTQAGLVRFDGLTFRVFSRQRTPGLPSNYVPALAHDEHSAVLWIGTGRGLARYAAGRFESVSPGGLPSDIVTALAVGSGGGLWVGTAAGVARLEQDRVSAVWRQAHGLPHGRVNALAVAPDGKLWVATPAGVARIGSGQAVEARFGRREGLPHPDVRALAFGPDGRLWAGTRQGPPAVLHPDGRFQRAPGAWPDGPVQALSFDRDGRLWAAGRDGLRLLDGRRLHSWRTGRGLTDDHVLALLSDREGHLWIGTERGGLNRLKPPRVQAYTQQHGLPDDSVLALIEDREGALWAGTWAGLARLHPDGRVERGIAGLESARTVLSLAQARAGGLWVGHLAGGVGRLAPGARRLVRVPQVPPTLTVFALHEDAEGTLWLGTDQGLGRLGDGRFTLHGRAQGLPDNTVFRVIPARAGGLWIATRGGLARWQDGRLQTVGPRSGVLAESLLALHEDADGSLWLGTFGAGLGHWQAGRASVFRVEHGLPDETVYEILDDGHGSLWVSGNRGVARLERSELEALEAGRVARVYPALYGRSDGLPRSECSGGSQPAGWKRRDGWLWFATVGGAVGFDPRRLSAATPPPLASVEALFVDHRPVTPQAAAAGQLPAGRGHLALRLTARTLAAPEKVRFRYRLEGLEDEWHDAGPERVASYAHVPPGRYVFSVAAANEAGQWSPPARLALRLPPQFHQTVWFRALPLLGVALLAFGLHQWRTRRLAARTAVLAERQRLAGELHDGLAQCLSGLLRQLDAARQELPGDALQVGERLERARELTRASLLDARRSVRALRPVALEQAGLEVALARTARELVEGSGVRLVSQVSGAPWRLPPGVEQHLFLAGQEALSNAVRHAGARVIRLHVAYRRRSVRVCVSDDGCGLPAACTLQSGGLGLRSMHERLRQAGGRLRFRSRPGQGTVVVAVVPLDGPPQARGLAWRWRYKHGRRTPQGSAGGRSRGHARGAGRDPAAPRGSRSSRAG